MIILGKRTSGKDAYQGLTSSWTGFCGAKKRKRKCPLSGCRRSARTITSDTRPECGPPHNRKDRGEKRCGKNGWLSWVYYCAAWP